MTAWRHKVSAFVLVAASACGGHRSLTAPPAAPEPTLAPPTTTRAALTPTTSPAGYRDATKPPALVDTGTKFAVILTSQLEYASWIAEHHVDSSLIAKIAAPGSPWEAAQLRQIAYLTSHHARFDEQYGGPASLALISVLPDVVSARYTQRITRQSNIDATSRATDITVPNTPTTSYIVVMARTGAHWRLVSVEQR